MLSPYAEPYYPETEKISCKAGILVRTENIGYKPMDKKQTKNDERKDIKQKPMKEKINIEYQKIETISKPKHTEWIKVRGNSSTVMSDKHKVNTNAVRHENTYDTLAEEDEKEEEEYVHYTSQDDEDSVESMQSEAKRQNIQSDKEEDIQSCDRDIAIKDLNVNTMKLEDIEEVLKEVHRNRDCEVVSKVSDDVMSCSEGYASKDSAEEESHEEKEIEYNTYDVEKHIHSLEDQITEYEVLNKKLTKEIDEIKSVEVEELTNQVAVLIRENKDLKLELKKLNERIEEVD